MTLFFKAENTSGNVLAGADMEGQLRQPWDNYLWCLMEHFFAPTTPGIVPERVTLVDGAEGSFNFV